MVKVGDTVEITNPSCAFMRGPKRVERVAQVQPLDGPPVGVVVVTCEHPTIKGRVAMPHDYHPSRVRVVERADG